MHFDLYNQPVASALALLMAVFWLGLADSIQRITKRIREAYPILWDELGTPDSFALSWLLGPLIFTMLLVQRPDFVRWLATAQHKGLEDAEIAKYVVRLRFFFSIFTATVVTAVLYAAFQLAFL